MKNHKIPCFSPLYWGVPGLGGIPGPGGVPGPGMVYLVRGYLVFKGFPHPVLTLNILSIKNFANESNVN